MPGEHELALYLPGYKTVTDKLLFRPRQSYKMHYELQKLAAGEPPPVKPLPSPTTRRPTVDDPDQFPMAGDPNQPPAPEQGRQEGPPRTQAPPDPGTRDSGTSRSDSYGTLSVRVQPSDAVIAIDGERWDTPSGAMRLSVELPPGTHRVEIHKDGFAPYTTEVTVRAGDVTRLNVSLNGGHQQ